MTKGQGKTFVEIHKTDDLAIAGLIKEVLEDNGIVFYLDNYHTTHILYPLAYRGIKIMVYKDHVEDAKGILNLFFNNQE